MSGRGSNNVGRAVRTDTTLLRRLYSLPHEFYNALHNSVISLVFKGVQNIRIYVTTELSTIRIIFEG